MALTTIGTAATNTLTALVFRGSGTVDDDYRNLSSLIQNDGVGEGDAPWSVSRTGLYIPRRGQIRLFPGDYVAIDPATGFPVVISATAAASANWVHP